MYCNKCGTKNEDGANFCTECGAKLNNPSSDSSQSKETEDYPAQAETNPVKKKPNRRRSRIAIIAVIVIAFLVGLFLLHLPSDIYIYSTTTLKTNEIVTEEEQNQIESLFKGTYLYITQDDHYAVLNPVSGLGFNEQDLKENNDWIVEFSANGGYVFFEFYSADNESDKVIVTYSKPTIREYCYFVTKTNSWF